MSRRMTTRAMRVRIVEHLKREYDEYFTTWTEGKSTFMYLRFWKYRLLIGWADDNKSVMLMLKTPGSVSNGVFDNPKDVAAAIMATWKELQQAA